MIEIPPPPNPADHPSWDEWYLAAIAWSVAADEVNGAANAADGQGTPDPPEGSATETPDEWYRLATEHRTFSLRYFNEWTFGQRRAWDAEHGWDCPLEASA